MLVNGILRIGSVMASLDLEYLGKLVARFKGFKKPNDTQKLIILLGENHHRDVEDDKKLVVLLRAEKKADQLLQARRAANNILNLEKNEKRKLEARKKIIWGSVLIKMAKNDVDVAQTMTKLFESGHLTDKDKVLIKAEYDEAKKTAQTLDKRGLELN